MNKYYITFGYAHIHGVAGQTIDHDCVVEVEAGDSADARQKAIDLFGTKFCTIVQEKPDMSYYPRGIIRL